MRKSDEITLAGSLGIPRTPTRVVKAEHKAAPNYERALDTAMTPNARTKPSPARLVRERSHIVGF